MNDANGPQLLFHCAAPHRIRSVSYTHLDVYKRQIKRRCAAGMGRCQGGFCEPRIHDIMARELGVPMKDILQDTEGSYIVTGETKED